MNLLVSREILLFAEAVSTQVTDVRPIPSVPVLVFTKTGQVPKGLPTLCTLVGLLGRVAPLVLVKIGGVRISLPAFGAVVRLLPRVNTQVRGEVVQAGKPLSTNSTGEGPLPPVDPLVQSKFLLHSEALPTLEAFMRFFSPEEGPCLTFCDLQFLPGLKGR